MKFLIGDPSKGHGGHSRSPTVFLPITWDPNEIETWNWCHCVCLCKAHQMMYNLTYLGHLVTLPWLDLRSNLTLIFQGQTIHGSTRLDKAKNEGKMKGRISAMCNTEYEMDRFSPPDWKSIPVRTVSDWTGSVNHLFNGFRTGADWKTGTLILLMFV